MATDVERDTQNEDSRKVSSGDGGCTQPSAATLATIERFAEEQRSRLRPPGIDDWCNEIAAEAEAMQSAMTCRHDEMLECSCSSSAGYTYVVQAGSGGLVKIGRAVWVARRLVSIQTASPVRLNVVAIVFGIGLERAWHKKFYKLRRHREWFDPEVVQFFRDNGAPGCVRCAIYKDALPPRKPRPLTPTTRTP
jgi:hypothetical protein